MSGSCFEIIHTPHDVPYFMAHDGPTGDKGLETLAVIRYVPLPGIYSLDCKDGVAMLG